eukprot:TRINITY_DN39192_c0_g1_i1.p1 TRINITY_DN39192_c0_g1~~TRINITY_DN39192_c0_g1_i1.p1  ORF type:complete len:285 (+),score=89.35 TRINITY_DN39192_c0_g1_i1:67-855(+)
MASILRAGCFSGRRCVVTGAGKGIGRAVALRMSGLGAEVVAVARTGSDLDSLAAEAAKAGGGRVLPVVCDVADPGALTAALTGAGPIDMLVNNAGIAKNAPFLEATAADFDATIAVNVRSAMIAGQVAAKSMISRGVRGSIVNVSSQASMVGLKDHTAYCTSKGAVDQLTRMMALELGAHGIRTNAVNPTVVLTDMARREWSDPAKAGPMLSKIPLGKFAEVGDVTDVIAFLLSDGAGMVNGIVMPIDGGFLAAPDNLARSA